MVLYRLCYDTCVVCLSAVVVVVLHLWRKGKGGTDGAMPLVVWTAPQLGATKWGARRLFPKTDSFSDDIESESTHVFPPIEFRMPIQFLIKRNTPSQKHLGPLPPPPPPPSTKPQSANFTVFDDPRFTSYSPYNHDCPRRSATCSISFQKVSARSPTKPQVVSPSIIARGEPLCLLPPTWPL